MSDNYFVVDAQLPSLNEYQRACRTNPFVGAKFKEDTEDIILWSLQKAKQDKTAHRVKEYPVQIKITWHEKDKRRDVDNIKSAAKFILDAMTKSGLIKDDSRRFVSQIHDLVVDDKKTFVVVEILNEETI